MSPLNKNGLYCAYLRKSRKDMELEALGQEETLARHEAQLSALAERLGIRVAQTYREVVSGDTIAERPEVRRLLDDVGAGLWDGVLVMDVDRLGRGDSIDQGVIMQTFLYSGTLIVTPDKVYDPSDESDSEFFEIKLFFSRREYNMIKKRMQRGRVAAALAGCYSSPRPPYGYERYKLPDRKGWSIRPVPECADIVRLVFNWYAFGMDGQTVGTNIIAARLHEMGVKTYLGYDFSPSSLQQMLRNPVYIGKVTWNKRQTVQRIENGRRVKSRPASDNAIVVDGLHEPIIDRALFDRVQAMFATHAKRPTNVGRPTVNPLCGLIVCGECGHAMFLKGTPGKKYGDFMCCQTQRCPTCSAYASVVFDLVRETLGGWVTTFEASAAANRERDAAQISASEASVRQLEANLKTLEGQSGRLFDLLETGVYDVPTYRQRRADLDARIAQAREALDAARGAPGIPPMARLVPRLKTVLAAYDATESPAEKNDLLKQVVQKIIYHKTTRCYRNSNPADHLTLDIIPRIPSEDEADF